MSRDEIELLVRRAGLTLIPDQMELLVAGAASVAEAAANVRRPRPHTAEPAHAFTGTAEDER